MRIKAGKITLALTMVAAGIMMLIDSFTKGILFGDLWIYSPVVIIALGLEIIILNLIYYRRDEYTVEISAGSIMLIIVVVSLFVLYTNRVDVKSPLIRHLLG